MLQSTCVVSRSLQTPRAFSSQLSPLLPCLVLLLSVFLARSSLFSACPAVVRLLVLVLPWIYPLRSRLSSLLFPISGLPFAFSWQPPVVFLMSLVRPCSCAPFLVLSNLLHLCYRQARNLDTLPSQTVSNYLLVASRE